MKHAGPECLERLAAVRAALASMPGLIERKPGIFYLRGAAFLHFHEDPTGVFADAKTGGTDFDRWSVNTPEDESALLAAVEHRLQAVTAQRRASAASR